MNERVADVRIEQVRIDSVKRLKRGFTLCVAPDQRSIRIGGKNRNGKSSIADSVCVALWGPGSFKLNDPVHHGDPDATVIVKTNAFTVRRHFADGKTSFTVTDDLGNPSDMDFVRGFLGETFVDPLEFCKKLQPIEQRELLCRRAGIDWEAEYRIPKKGLLDQAKEADQTYERLKAQAAHLEEFPDAPDQEVDTALLQQQLRQAQESVTARQEAETRVLQLDAKIKVKGEQIAEAEATIARLRAEIEACEEAKAGIKLPEVVDTAPIVEQINQAAETNKKVAQNRFKQDARVAAQKALDDRTAAHQALIDHETAFKQRMAQAEFPLPGLSIDESGTVTYNGVPLSNVSQAEEIDIGLAVSLAGKGRLAPTFVRSASLLDDEYLALIEERCAAQGSQVFFELVTNSRAEAKERRIDVLVEDGERVEVAS